MLHFGTGVLLYLAAGALAAPANQKAVRDVEAASTSSEGNDASSASSVASTINASSSTDLSSSAATSTTTDTVATTTASESGVSVAPSATGGTNFTSLYGPDLRPDIAHLGAIQEAVKGSPNETIFESAASILLGLTKCNDTGGWIKSFFTAHVDVEGEGDQGGDIVDVHIYERIIGWKKDWPKMKLTIDRNNLKNITNVYKVDQDKIPADEPWWAWALIEAALQAGWNPNVVSDVTVHIPQLLQVLTADLVQYADTTPIFVLDGEDEVYSVVMTPPPTYQEVNENHVERVYKLAVPYLRNPDDDGLTQPFTPSELNVTSYLYLEDRLTLEQVLEQQKADS